MEINANLYNWLCDAGICDASQEPNFQNSYLLSEAQSQSLENGLEFPKLLSKVYSAQKLISRELSPVPEISSLKEVKSPASKLYNWKLVSSALEPLGIKVDPDARSLIIAGDREMVVEVLQQMYDKEQSARKRFEERRAGLSSSEMTMSKKSLRMSPKVQVVKQYARKNTKDNGNLNIDSIRANKALEECGSCLEFLLVSFCKDFGVKPKQAAGLLTQSGKYLFFVITKGLKGRHEPVQSWYQSIYSSLSHLLALISQEEVTGSLPLVFSSIKSGFYSKSIDTILWCCRLFSKIGAELTEKDMLPPAWDWFVSENGGLEACLSSLSHFAPFVKAQIVSVLVQFARNNFFELFTIQLRNHLPDPAHYFATINELLPSFCEIRTAKQELLAAGIVDFWFDMALRETKAENKRAADVRLAGINFICDVWIIFPSFIERREEIGSELLNVVKRTLRDQNKVLCFGLIGKLFYVLSVFTTERNPYAPIIYKTLTFYLVEQYNDRAAREMILSNFCVLFEALNTIPVGVLVEPLAKQMQVANDIQFQVSDFDFFTRVARHPRLNVKNGVQTMDALGKVYLNDEVYAKAAAIPFMMIASRYIDERSVHEYLFRFIKYGLTLALKLELKAKNKEAEASEWEVKQRYQRNMMLDMAQRVIKLKQHELNEKILAEICNINMKPKLAGKKNFEFVLTLLKLFGDPKEIIKLYEQEKVKSSLSVFEEAKANEAENEKIETLPTEEMIKTKQVTAGNATPKMKTSGSTGSLPKATNAVKGRVQLEIEKIRQNMIEKEIARRMKEEKERVAKEKKKILLRKQIEKRKIELAVQSKAEKHPKSEEIKPINIGILIELSESEREMIGYLLKRYNRVLKLLFKKYSSTGYNKARVGKETFETAAEKNSTLSESEFYKLLKEQGITSSMLTSEESNSLMKAFCHKQQKPIPKINFSEFQELLIQVSLFIFSNPPKDLSHLPPVMSLKALFDHFRAASADRGISTKFYDEPDPGVGDRDVVKQLNLLLEKDPATPLPEGFRRVVEKEIEVVYNIPESVAMPESFAYAVGALDMILVKCLGVHLLEPMIAVKEVVRARGVLEKPRRGYADSRLSSKLSQYDTGFSVVRSGLQPGPAATELLLTPGIKFEIARLTGKVPNDRLYEVAKLVDDLLYSVDSGSSMVISRNSKKKAVNKAVIMKEQSESQKVFENKNKEKRRQLRKQVIEERLKKAREEREKRKKEENEKKEAEEKKVKEEKKKHEEKRRKIREKREKEISEWKTLKMQEEEKKKVEEGTKKEKEEIARKKKREGFLKAVKSNLQLKVEVRHEMEEEFRKQKEQEMKLKEKQKVTKKQAIVQKINKEKKAVEESLKQREEFNKIKADTTVRTYLDRMYKSVNLLFLHYCKAVPNKDGSMPTTIGYPSFVKFCTSFNIVPGILNHEECLKVFRLTTKLKKHAQGETVSLNFEDFEEVLIRLSAVCKQTIEAETHNVIETNENMIKEFLEYLNVTNDPRHMRDLLKEIEEKAKNMHPREKRRMKNQLNKSISRESSPMKQSAKKLERNFSIDSQSGMLRPPSNIGNL